MHRALGLAVIGSILCVGPALAQGTRGPAATLRERTPATTPPVQQLQRQAPKPLFFLFGIPVVIDAPVAPPYCNCAYVTLAGQPATGADAAAGLLSRLGQ